MIAIIGYKKIYAFLSLDICKLIHPIIRHKEINAPCHYIIKEANAPYVFEFKLTNHCRSLIR